MSGIRVGFLRHTVVKWVDRGSWFPWAAGVFRLRQMRGVGFVGLMALLGAGCQAVPVMQQRLVSKPNMVFSDSPVFSYQSQVLPQIEPGSAMSGGAQAAGCTACQ